MVNASHDAPLQRQKEREQKQAPIHGQEVWDEDRDAGAPGFD